MAEFAAFVKYVEEGMGLPLSDEIPRTELLHRLHYATDGVVGNVMNLMRCTALLAHKQDTEQLTLSILGQAFEKRLWKHMAGKINSFTADPDRHFVAPEMTPVNAPNSTNRRSRRRKKRGPTAKDVLTTE